MNCCPIAAIVVAMARRGRIAAADRRATRQGKCENSSRAYRDYGAHITRPSLTQPRATTSAIATVLGTIR